MVGKVLSMDELLGYYSLDVVQNPWQEGDIIKENGTYFWKNKANVKWIVTPNFVKGKLETGNDCPYPGEVFSIELYKDSEGNFILGAVGLKFSNETYKKRFNLLRGKAPIEIVLGNFERVPNLITKHTGKILKTVGKFRWLSDAGDTWQLLPNTTNESFGLDIGSPTPNEKFQLILVNTACNIQALGFKYLGYYYWKPKKSLLNTSPTLVNKISDLVLKENFGTYTINLANVFKDKEQDSLLYFVTSVDTSFVSAEISSGQLILSGGKIGSNSIFLMALDANGGLAVNLFNVKVNPLTSTEETASKIKVYPHITHDIVHIDGLTSDYSIILSSLDNSHQQKINV